MKNIINRIIPLSEYKEKREKREKKKNKMEHVILFYKLSASTTPFGSTILQLHQTCVPI